MEQPLHPGSTVHHGGFINFFIHACQRRNINDGVPAHAGPYAGNVVDGVEILRVSQIINRFQSQILAQGIQQAHRRRDDVVDHRHHNDHGNEIGHKADGLVQLFGLWPAHFVNHQSKDDRRKRLPENRPNTEQDGVFQKRREIAGTEEFDKVLQSHIFASGKSAQDFIVVKGDPQIGDGDVLKHDKVHNDRDHHGIDPAVAKHALP